ncbi:hypothetical protein B0I08_101546 [Glaciihabitans tibetensis]|uniref:Condensation domain-containing protein n=1 Tax=Glaciihabitans tibetensis TaxID=1266600 RepID=A0A2T0VJK2_9MICO|nr:hypothetical protein [Glaciihabitans tibetensis]PRY70411.1 hypothetical protein B0I08_101546 [Glaciihabitans tibetensis]
MTETKIRMTLRDRLMRGEAVVGIVGPLKVPERAAVVRALHTLALCGPQTRIGLGFDLDGKSWRYDPAVLAQWCEDIVITLPAVTAESVVTVANRQAWLLDAEHPLRFALAGDYVIQVNDHALGDGVLFVDRLSSVIRMAGGTTELPSWATTIPGKFPLRSAVVSTFVRRRGAVRALVADRRKQHGRSDEAASRETLLWRPDVAVLDATIPAAQMASIKKWSREIDPALSISSALIVLLRRSLQEAGVPLQHDTTVIYNLRRYLPNTEWVVDGNFIAGLPVRVKSPDDVRSVGAGMLGQIESARPLAALVIGVVRAAIFGVPLTLWREVTAHPRMELVFNNLGRASPLEILPWSAPPGGRTCVIVTRPGGPEEAVALVALIEGELHVTVTFHGNVFDADRVSNALRLLAADPLGERVAPESHADPSSP